jgi:hypothetical protein
MTNNCLLRLLLELQLLRGLRRNRGEARGLNDNRLTMHSNRDRANKRLGD